MWMCLRPPKGKGAPVVGGGARDHQSAGQGPQSPKPIVLLVCLPETPIDLFSTENWGISEGETTRLSHHTTAPLWASPGAMPSWLAPCSRPSWGYSRAGGVNYRSAVALTRSSLRAQGAPSARRRFCWRRGRTQLPSHAQTVEPTPERKRHHSTADGSTCLCRWHAAEGVHMDVLAPSLSTKDRLRPRLGTVFFY